LNQVIARPILKLKSRLQRIPVKDMAPNPDNPREEESRFDVTDIRQSLESVGEILVPLVVCPNRKRRKSSDPKYIILDGERRWRAASELAKKDRRFSKVPANVVSGQLSKYENLKTMFNIHMKRKEWSTSAVAEALDDLFRTRPSLKNASVKNIAFETGLGNTEVREAMQFLRMPADDRDRALRGDLDEYYLILLSRNMRSIQNGFPKLITDDNWHSIAKIFIKRVDDGWIDDARSFISLGKAARECLDKGRPDVFERSFSELLKDPKQTPDDTLKQVESELLITTEKEFLKQAKLFLRMLRTFLGQSDYRVGVETNVILQELRSEAEKTTV